jgi:hypothetical protein
MLARQIAAVVLACLPLGGCFSYHRAAADRPAPDRLAAEAWPRHDTAPLVPLTETPGVIRRYEVDRAELARDKKLSHLTEAQLDLAADEAANLHAIEVLDSRLTDGGLIRLWRDPRNDDAHTYEPMIFSFGGRLELFTRRGSFLTPDQLAWREAREASRARHGLVDRPPYRGTDVRGVTTSDEADRWLLHEGYDLGFSVPDAQPVGLAIHLTSLYENKYEHAVIRRLRNWGWAIGHIDTRLGVRGPLAEQAMDRRNEREALLESRMPLSPPGSTQRHDEDVDEWMKETTDYIERRYELGEQLKKDLPDIGTGFELTPDSDPEQIADLIARAADRRLAEHADAAAALVDSLDALHPQLAGRPLLVTGFSAGALAAPTVAARLRERHPDRQILLVLVGGGATLLDIARTSELTDGGIRLQDPGGPEPTPEQLAVLQNRYESKSRLDPIHTAAALRDIPVLHIYADRDTVVPTAAAERLNAAHGSVDRLVHHGDHDTLLYLLNTEASRIRSWLRAHGVE